MFKIKKHFRLFINFKHIFSVIAFVLLISTTNSFKLFELFEKMDVSNHESIEGKTNTKLANKNNLKLSATSLLELKNQRILRENDNYELERNLAFAELAI